MKNLKYLFAIAGASILYGCSQQAPKETATAIPAGLKAGKQSYLAIFVKDSAKLDLDIDQYGKVTGKLLIKYGELKPDATELIVNTGDVSKGEFKGDTLVADYTFTSGKDKTLYTNPLALLHKGDTLIMGSGRIMNYLGRTYFDPQTGVQYQKARFRFVPVKK